MDELKQCPFCGGKTEKKTIETKATWGKVSICVDGIEADICQDCNEEFYTMKDAKMLEDIVKSATNHKRKQNKGWVNMKRVNPTTDV